jgi:hypothetical protein
MIPFTWGFHSGYKQRILNDDKRERTANARAITQTVLENPSRNDNSGNVNKGRCMGL